MKQNSEMTRVFVTLPADVVSTQLSPQLQSLLHTRMADYNECTTLLSSCDALNTLYRDHSNIVEEKCNSTIPVNWYATL